MGAHKLITPPTEYPVVLDDLVSVHIKVDDTDEEAGLIREFIAASTEKVEDILQRQLMQATWEYHMKDFSDSGAHCEMDCEGYIRLLKAPIVTVVSVKYYDVNNAIQTLTASEYEVDTTSEPGRIRFNGSIPGVYDRNDAVKIQYIAGYGAVDSTKDQQRTAITNYRAGRAKVAILRAVADLYEHRQDESATQSYEINENIRAWLNPLRLYL